MDALSTLYKGPACDPSGVQERKGFASRIPNFVVTVDELAGDGAGSPFVHAVASWLYKEFIGCFEAEPSPYTVTLVGRPVAAGVAVLHGLCLTAATVRC
jgi:hypothetical protein